MIKSSWFPKMALFGAVIVLSQAGNLIRLCDAEPTSVAFFRLLFALVIMLPLAIMSLKKETFTSLNVKSWILWALMGLLFAAHFVFWIAAVQKTTVANAAIFFSMTPLFVAVGARFLLKENLHPNIFITIGLGLIGMIVMGFSDFSFGSKYLLGDILALVAGAFFASYLLVGKKLRLQFDNRVMMGGVYIAGILFLLPFVLNNNISLTNFSGKTILGLTLLAIFPTILGHATMIYVMRFFKASTVSTVVLAEPILAGIVAWIAYDEAITIPALLGYVLISCGLILLFKESSVA